MDIESKYKLQYNPLNLRVIQSLDFQDYPILNIEVDVIGNKYLSYLIRFEKDFERRALIQISEDRLKEVATGNLNVTDAFNKSETNNIYVCDFMLKDGKNIATYLIPSAEFSSINPIPPAYVLSTDKIVIIKPIFDGKEILDYASRKNKLVLDIYIQGQNLINSIKPYAFYKVVTPIVEIVKSFLDIDQRNVDKYLAFSNIRQKSLGITIEVNFSGDLFLERENTELIKVIELLNAETKEDFEKIISKSKNESYFKEYSKIIKAIIENNAELFSAFANPISQEIIQTKINKEKAEKVKEILDETLSTIEDVEEIKGQFLEIDIDKKEPSFKIYSIEDDFTLKGKIEISLLSKLKTDMINIGSESYLFTVKMIYHPETTVRPEETKRYLINYKKL